MHVEGDCAEMMVGHASSGCITLVILYMIIMYFNMETVLIRYYYIVFRHRVRSEIWHTRYGKDGRSDQVNTLRGYQW